MIKYFMIRIFYEYVIIRNLLSALFFCHRIPYSVFHHAYHLQNFLAIFSYVFVTKLVRLTFIHRMLFMWGKYLVIFSDISCLCCQSGQESLASIASILSTNFVISSTADGLLALGDPNVSLSLL